jgi:membrane-bound ClpP family serine protease
MLFWGLGLMAGALLLLVADIFLPTAGILALTSFCTAIAGVYCLFQYSTEWGVIGVLVVAIGGPSIFFIGLQVMPQTPLGRKLVLGGEHASDQPPPKQDNPLLALVGKEGVVVTALRPVGSIRIDEARYEALSESQLVGPGSRVQVIAIVDGTMLKVRQVS